MSASISGEILSGKATIEYHEEFIRRKIKQFEQASAAPLHLSLAAVQFGDSSDVQLYARSLEKTFSRFGIHLVHKKFSASADEQKASLAGLTTLYGDPSITGTLVFSPIPQTVNAANVFLNMPLDKDLEGRTFMKRSPFGVFSPTAKAVMALLKHLERIDKNFRISGLHAIMVGHSDLVGKPTAMLLSDAGATVTVCHQFTRDLERRIGEADILVVAIGKPRFIKGEWIKKGAVVVDVGENVLDGKIVGDVDFESALRRAAYVSPVPGGVGPLTSLMVIENLLMLHEYKGLHPGA